MQFPVSGVVVAPWVPPLVAFCISFLTSMGGVSGAFLLLPFQMSVLGYTHPSVSATNQVFNIVAIPSGVYRFCKEGRMVWPLTWTVVIGTLPGVFIGALVRVNGLRDPRNFKLFAGLVILYIAGKMIKDLLKKQSATAITKSSCGGGVGGSSTVTEIQWTLRRLRFVFQDKGYDVSGVGIFTLCFIVGIIGGIYGIGGGAIISPFLVTLFGLPVYTIAGASLMGTFVTSIAGVSFYSALAPFYPGVSIAPDWFLGMLFGLGGMAGMYLGARCQKFVPARVIKWMLVSLLLFTSLKYIIDFFR